MLLLRLDCWPVRLRGVCLWGGRKGVRSRVIDAALPFVPGVDLAGACFAVLFAARHVQKTRSCFYDPHGSVSYCNPPTRTPFAM